MKKKLSQRKNFRKYQTFYKTMVLCKMYQLAREHDVNRVVICGKIDRPKEAYLFNDHELKANYPDVVYIYMNINGNWNAHRIHENSRILNLGF